MRLWEVKTKFSSMREVVRVVSGQELRVGSFPNCEVRLPKSFPQHLLNIGVDANGQLSVSQQDVKAKARVQGGVLVCEWGDLRIEIRELSGTKKLPGERLSSWVGLNRIEAGDSHVILWHLFSGQIVETLAVPREGQQKLSLPVSGFQFHFDWSMRKLVLHLPGGDLRTVELKVQDSVLSGEWGAHQFVVSSQADAALAESLVPRKEFERTQKREHFAPVLMLVLGLWICFVAFLQFGPSLTPLEETVEEKLSPEYAKVRIEKKQKEVQKQGQDAEGGARGGGGVESAQTQDPNGGAGVHDEVLVQDRNVLASAVGVLDAFSNLDQKMEAAVNKVGAGVLGGSNRARGILAALGNMSGSGGGGVGIGGLGTKGFGGGGGGGSGNGFGTGIGSGVGKGEAGRGVAFEDSSVSIRGALEKSEINAVVDENFAQIRFCYNRALRSNPSLKGKVISNFVIDANGTVSVSRISSTTLLNPTVENCIRERIATWQFPKPRGGGSVTVNYPFLFNRT